MTALNENETRRIISYLVEMDEQSLHLIFIEVNQLYKELDDSLDLVYYLTQPSMAIRSVQKTAVKGNALPPSLLELYPDLSVWW